MQKCITEDIKKDSAVPKICAEVLLIHIEVSAHTSKNYGITYKAEESCTTLENVFNHSVVCTAVALLFFF